MAEAGKPEPSCFHPLNFRPIRLSTEINDFIPITEKDVQMENPVLSFDHVHLVSKDPVAAADWYAEKLGGHITATAQVRGAPQVLVRFQGATIIIRGQRTGESAADRKGLQWGVDHFGFQVGSDFDGYCDGLKSNGVVFTLEPVDFGPDLRIAFIQAPDGVSIELLHRKAG